MILICDDKLLTFALMLLTTVLAACEKKILTFTAHERGKVELRCPYESGYEENEKYLCSGGCILGFKNIPVESGSPAEDQRFSLTDDTAKRVFSVTITDLRAEDGRQYWCGITTGFGMSDDYTKIDLNIKHVSRVSAVSGQNVSITCPYDHDLMDDVKFICKGSDPSLCVKSATKVSSEKRKNGRFSLKDDQSEGVFTVSIRDLTEEDSGIYWCGAVEGKTHKWISVKELVISNVSAEEASPTETTTTSFHSSKPTETTSDRAVTSPSSSSTSPSLLLLFPSSDNDVFAVVMLMVIGTLTGFGFALFLYFSQKQKKEGLCLRNVLHGLDLLNTEVGETKNEATRTICHYEAVIHTDNLSGHTLDFPVFGKQDIFDPLIYSTVIFQDTSDITSDGH